MKLRLRGALKCMCFDFVFHRVCTIIRCRCVHVLVQVLMFVNISPVLWNAPETTCSLNFAQRCRTIELGTAKKNTESGELARLRRLVESLGGSAAASGASSAALASAASSAPAPAAKKK